MKISAGCVELTTSPVAEKVAPTNLAASLCIIVEDVLDSEVKFTPVATDNGDSDWMADTSLQQEFRVISGGF